LGSWGRVAGFGKGADSGEPRRPFQSPLGRLCAGFGLEGVGLAAVEEEEEEDREDVEGEGENAPREKG